jgi:ABC-2 type transport system ATP-binding protein
MSVKIENIGKSFDGIRALEGLSLRVEEGEIFGLIGPDGAGKSTLFRIIASLLLPDGGTCTVQGYDTVKQYKEVRKVIGYMPGRFSLYMDLTVEENLAFYARVFGTTFEANYNLIKDVYHQIEPFRKRQAGKLSGGMKQKLALSCALIHRPEVLILDEPTTGVDAVSRREFWEMLRKIRMEGITVIVSTPYMDEAAMCDRVAMIQKGLLLGISDPSDPLERFSGKLYSLRSDRGLYTYLKRIREMEACRSAYLFGDELHVTVADRAGAESIRSSLGNREDASIVWKEIKPGVEDRFMELMKQE